jgi:hypothetical protein
MVIYIWIDNRGWLEDYGRVEETNTYYVISTSYNIDAAREFTLSVAKEFAATANTGEDSIYFLEMLPPTSP